MHIRILCSSRELFGADRSAIRLGSVLKDLGATATLVVPDHRPERGLREEADRRGLGYETAELIIASSRGVSGVRLGARGLSQPADAVVVNSLAVLGPTGNVPKVIMIREWLSGRSLRHRALAAWHSRGAAWVNAVSSDVLRQWEVCRPASAHAPVAVAPNWLDEQTLADGRQVDREEVQREGILFLGRFNRWKGQGLLADAYEAAFAKSDEQPSLTFVGAEYDSSEFAPAAIELDRRGISTGWRVLPFDSLPAQFLREAALVVVPSLHPEPFGSVVLEALNYGCRVLATSGGGPKDMAERFTAVGLLNPTLAGLATELRAWWSDGGRGQGVDEMKHTRAMLSEFYSEAAAARQWREVLQNVVSKH
jgi:glycosyltransferase involved in cell wall biosynthesis